MLGQYLSIICFYFTDGAEDCVTAANLLDKRFGPRRSSSYKIYVYLKKLKME